MSTYDEQKTDLAGQRTLLAGERTLMAWIRTAFSMITFGFSIFRFFQFIDSINRKVPLIGVRSLGLMLIALGTLGLIGGIGEYVAIYRQVHPQRVFWYAFLSHSVIIAILLVILGIAFFINLLLRPS